MFGIWELLKTPFQRYITRPNTFKITVAKEKENVVV